MPKAKTAKTTTKKASKSTTKKASKASKKAAPAEEPVDAAEVTLVEETAPEPSPEPIAADSSAEDSHSEEQDPFEQALSQVDTLLDFAKASFEQAHQRHRTLVQGLKDARKLVVALKRKGRKRKSTGKKSNSNSGIVGQRNISDQIRAFLGADEGATRSYTELCSDIMNYGKEHNLQGMKTTDADGNEKVDNRYIHLDAKLKKLFSNYDAVQKEVAAAGKETLLKEGKTRWVNRAGVMKLIKPHLLEAVPTTAAAGVDEEAAEASS